MRRRTILAAITAATCLATIAGAARAEVTVMTTTPTLANITRQIGGDLVSVTSVMRGPEDAHNVRALPSHAIKLRKADLFIHSGLGAEPWAELLARTARQRRFLPGGRDAVDASRGVKIKEKPDEHELSPAHGHVHAGGNPHYLLDPLNGVTVARTITAALSRVDQANTATYQRNLQKFTRDIEELAESLQEAMKPHEGAPVVVYHKMWIYLLDRFGLQRAGAIEPKPGIEPGPGELLALINAMKSRDIRVILLATYDNAETARAVARRTGATVIAMAHEANAIEGVDTYQKMLRHNVTRIAEALNGGATASAAERRK